MSTTAAQRRHCCFLVGGECFAVPAECVAEVLRDSRMTRVPRAPQDVVGLVHLRGRIVPVVDMRRHLGVTGMTASTAVTHLVICVQDDWYSLLVDEMRDVVAVDERFIEPCARAATEAAGDTVHGTFAGPSCLIHILDPHRIVLALSQQRDQSLHRHGALHGSD